MKSRLEPLTSTADIQELAQELKKHPIIAFDTEFIRESTFYPVVEIIQLATENESWIVDAQPFKDSKTRENLRPLLDVLQDKSILKTVHAAQGDQECLYTSFGIVATPTLDTAVAASLCGYGESIGLGNLLKSLMGVTIKKGHARTNWSVRPLPSQLLEYAHADVKHLVASAVKLMEQLEKVKRKDWALELSAKWEDITLYQSDPEAMAHKLVRGGKLDHRGYATLLELVKWREERVRQVNLPRRWVADDNILMDLAHVRPKDMAHLATFRGLNKGELQKSGEAILAAIRRGADAKDVALPRMPKPEIPTAAEGQALELLRCFVGILADRHEIALKHLMSSGQLLPLLRSKIEQREDLVSKGFLSDSSARLIGDEVIAMLRGKRALSIDGHRVKIVEIPSS